MTVPLDGSQWPQRVSHADFAWDPAWSPDGRELAWHEWNLPDMPWDASRVVVRDDDGKTQIVADGPACGQPRFSPDGAHLAYIREQQLWIDDARLLDEGYEHAETSWSAGQRSYAWSPDGREIAWCRNEDGFGRLVIGAPGRKSARDVSKGWHRGLVVGRRRDRVHTVGRGDARPGGRARAERLGPPERCARCGRRVRSGRPRRAARRQLEVGEHERARLAVAPAGRDRREDAAAGQRARRPDRAVDRRLEPAHPVLRATGAGPCSSRITAARQATARPYRRALEGRWGERDTADVAAGIRHAVKEGWCDARLVALMGGSAGGLTVLNVAAAHPHLVVAVIALFPVTDLLELDATTHRFESGYNTRLVGPLPDARDKYVAQSAVTHAANIRAPVLLLHGDADTSVPASQSAVVEEMLRRAGTPVERHVYEGEGHGWRRAATVADEIARIDDFLQRRMG